MFKRFKYNSPTNNKVSWAVFIAAIAIVAVLITILLIPALSDDSCQKCGEPSGFYIDFESNEYENYLSMEKKDPFAMASVDNLALYNEGNVCGTCHGTQYQKPFSKSLALSSAGDFLMAFPAEPASTIEGLAVSFDIIVPYYYFDFVVMIGDGTNGIELSLVSGYWYIKHVLAGDVYTDQMLKTESSMFQMPSTTGINTFTFEFLSPDTFSVSYNGQPAIGMHTNGQNSWVMEDAPATFDTLTVSCNNVITFYVWTWIDNVHVWRP